MRKFRLDPLNELRRAVGRLERSKGKRIERYHGVRYEDGTIAGKRMVVSVLPEDGQPYFLKNEQGSYVHDDADSIEWGYFFRNLPKLEAEAMQKSIYETNAMYFSKRRKRSAADWKRLENHKKKCRRLALRILLDLVSNKDAARKVHEEFSGKIIERLPESEWWLTEEQIHDAVGASLVLAALSTIGERK